MNTNEKVKPNFRSTIHEEASATTNDEIQKRLVGYVSIQSLSSTIPNETTDATTARRKVGLTEKQHSHFGRICLVSFILFIQNQFCLDKSFNEDDEYIEEEEINSELEDSDVEFNLKNKQQQKFNPNVIRNKIIKMFKRKPNQPSTVPSRANNATTTNPTIPAHQQDRFIVDHHSDFEEDPPSDISDSTIPVDQWSIESVPKPGFTPVEHLQVLKFVS